MAIRLTCITKCFGDVAAIDRVDLDVDSGELVAVLGPSGSGKTTLLRMVAGLERPDSGALTIDGADALPLPPRDRRVGFVFQHYALFRHKTVADNVAFGLEALPAGERPPRTEIRRRVAEFLELVRLAPLAGRYPAQLSGGQRQRVALARALAVRPRILLLDEPFGALDAEVRKELRRWLRTLHDAMRFTGLFVTHDQEEALEVADRVAIMDRGRIVQIGTPAEVYDRPATAFVCAFLGPMNRLEGVAADGALHPGGGLPAIPFAGDTGAARGPVLAFVRPRDVEILADADGPVRVLGVRVIGAAIRVDLELAGQFLEAELDRARLSAAPPVAGDRCAIRFARLRVFPAA
ncbi:sulfate/molybdate ABC transporter ATP-binding protein [Azospirillum halopraeferens]|uniref:sulfate/molybdate ABC transporter ATP-binding protein n=1 Tax=Azospirillum halopraeferens TaxID=34010 RepID=UPI0004192BD2|nr:sulfate ABC transporter ATP-binding protein [Azospirillum halopraeferens]